MFFGISKVLVCVMWVVLFLVTAYTNNDNFQIVKKYFFLCTCEAQLLQNENFLVLLYYVGNLKFSFHFSWILFPLKISLFYLKRISLSFRPLFLFFVIYYFFNLSIYPFLLYLLYVKDNRVIMRFLFVIYK